MILLTNILNTILTEEHLFLYYDEFDVYKNPKSIKRMTSGLRGISDKNGDLFVIDDGGMHVLHFELANQLKAKGYIKFSGKFHKVVDQFDSFVTWERDGTSNTFRTSASIPELSLLSNGEIDMLDDLIKKVQSKNPKFKFLKEKNY
jgi:hypothetical protein